MPPIIAPMMVIHEIDCIFFKEKRKREYISRLKIMIPKQRCITKAVACGAGLLECWTLALHSPVSISMSRTPNNIHTYIACDYYQ